MALTVAIVDDSHADSEYVEKYVRAWAAEREIALHTECFPSAEAFLFRYEEKADFDLLLLDIEMDGMDGVSMARRIRRADGRVQIVFITGYSDYIAEGYEVAALHYLVKPLQPQKLYAVLDRAVERLAQEEHCLDLSLPGETVRIPLREICYIDVRQNYVTVHAGREYTLRMTLSEVSDRLDERFFRIGRGAIVNLRFVRRVTRTEVHLADGNCLLLPRGAYEPLNRAIISGN